MDAQKLSNIPEQRTDIRPARAFYIDAGLRIALVPFPVIQYSDLINRYRSAPHFHFFSLSGQLVRGDAPNLHSRIIRRNLNDISQKGFYRFRKRFSADCRKPFVAGIQDLLDFSPDITGIRSDSERDFAPVPFRHVKEQIGAPRRFSQAHGQYAGRLRIQRPGMSGSFRSGQSAYAGNTGKGTDPRRLINIDYPIHFNISPIKRLPTFPVAPKIPIPNIIYSFA